MAPRLLYNQLHKKEVENS